MRHNNPSVNAMVRRVPSGSRRWTVVSHSHCDCRAGSGDTSSSRVLLLAVVLQLSCSCPAVVIVAGYRLPGLFNCGWSRHGVSHRVSHGVSGRHKGEVVRLVYTRRLEISSAHSAATHPAAQRVVANERGPPDGGIDDHLLPCATQVSYQTSCGPRILR
jgi:hypothetical protein